LLSQRALLLEGLGLHATLDRLEGAGADQPVVDLEVGFVGGGEGHSVVEECFGGQVCDGPHATTAAAGIERVLEELALVSHFPSEQHFLPVLDCGEFLD